MGVARTITLTPGSLARQAYGQDHVVEQFRCSYGLNPAYRDRLDDGELKVVGVDSDGEVRVVELSAHRFFVATLFVPQLSSAPDAPHPLIAAYLGSVRAFRASRRT